MGHMHAEEWAKKKKKKVLIKSYKIKVSFAAHTPQKKKKEKNFDFGVCLVNGQRHLCSPPTHFCFSHFSSLPLKLGNLLGFFFPSPSIQMGVSSASASSSSSALSILDSRIYFLDPCKDNGYRTLIAGFDYALTDRRWWRLHRLIRWLHRFSATGKNDWYRSTSLSYFSSSLCFENFIIFVPIEKDHIPVVINRGFLEYHLSNYSG